jgi:D-alanyl-D-alanine carboxypeptidase
MKNKSILINFKLNHRKKVFLFSVIAIVFCTNVFSAENAECANLKNILNEFRNQYHIGGMALYVSTPKLECYLFSGTIHNQSKKQITENNLWQIGSITKSYFSAILLQLEAESEAQKIPIQFNISQPLSQWLPQYKEWRNITIKQLLNMTAGIYSYTELPGFTKMIEKNPNKIWTADEIVSLAYHHKPNLYFKPGDGWHYSDTNYIIVGQLIEAIYQKMGRRDSLQNILKNRIIIPLQLNQTFYFPNGLPTFLLSKMVHGYGYYDHQDWTRVNLSIAGSSGAIISTPKDVAKWILVLFSGKVLPKKQMAEMKTLVSLQTGKTLKSNAQAPGYSLGLANRNYGNQFGTQWGYNGGTMGYISNYVYSPKINMIISLIFNVGTIEGKPPRIDLLDKKLLNIFYANSNQVAGTSHH